MMAMMSVDFVLDFGKEEVMGKELDGVILRSYFLLLFSSFSGQLFAFDINFKIITCDCAVESDRTFSRWS